MLVYVVLLVWLSEIFARFPHFCANFSFCLRSMAHSFSFWASTGFFIRTVNFKVAIKRL